jgi:hypothetical protein
LRVELIANRRPVASVDYDEQPDNPGPVRAALPRGTLGGGGELRLAWRIRDPTSPADLGLGADTRPLALFMRRIGLDPGP